MSSFVSRSAEHAQTHFFELIPRNAGDCAPSRLTAFNRHSPMNGYAIRGSAGGDMVGIGENWKCPYCGQSHAGRWHLRRLYEFAPKHLRKFYCTLLASVAAIGRFLARPCSNEQSFRFGNKTSRSAVEQAQSLLSFSRELRSVVSVEE